MCGARAALDEIADAFAHDAHVRTLVIDVLRTSRGYAHARAREQELAHLPPVNYDEAAHASADAARTRAYDAAISAICRLAAVANSAGIRNAVGEIALEIATGGTAPAE